MHHLQPQGMEDSFSGASFEQIRIRVEVPNSPGSISELVDHMVAQGHQVEVVSMKQAGIRPFGVIGHIRVDGIECIAKIAGEHLPEDHPDYFEAFIRQGAIEQEYEGLKAATGLTPRLIGEIIAEGQTVGVLRQFIEGTPLADAIREGIISPEDALRQAIELAQAVNDRGFKLWDCEPNNLWLRPDGTVILIEGQCLKAYSDEERRNPHEKEKAKIFVTAMLEDVLPGA